MTMGDNSSQIHNRRSANIGRKPNKTVVVPPDFPPRHNLHDLRRIAQRWNIDFDCEVVPISRYGKLLRFDIFGGGHTVDEIVRAINKWIEDASTKAPASSSWAKLPAWEVNKWTEDKRREEEKEWKQMFKGQKPEDPETFLHKVEVEWPPELVEIAELTPRDVFGTKLEALDSIRTDDEVFIALVPNQRGFPNWQVEICGFDEDHTLAGEEAYRNMVKKIHMRVFLGYEKVNIILDEVEGIDVELERTNDWWPRKTFRIVPRLRVLPTVEPGTFREDGLHFTQRALIQHHIQRSIDLIQFDKGAYDFSIQYGCLALSNLPDREIGKKYNMASFSKGIDKNVGCHITKWLFDCDLGEQLLSRLMMDDDVLEPTKTSGGLRGFSPSALNETRPTFRGTWVLRDPNSPVLEKGKPAIRNLGRPTTREPHGGANTASQPAPPPQNVIVVQINWTEDEDEMYEKMAPMFYRLKPGYTGPVERMDINLLELGVSKGWRFELESMIPADKSTLSPIILNFADRVQLKPGYEKDLSSHQVFAQWYAGPSYQIEMFRLEKIYTFGIKKTGYQVEALAMWYPAQRLPCWGLTVRHRDWSSELCELERLVQGRKVNFGDIIETFLPSDGISRPYETDGLPQLEKFGIQENGVAEARNGIKILTEKLMLLSSLINGTRQPNPKPLISKAPIPKSPPASKAPILETPTFKRPVPSAPVPQPSIRKTSAHQGHTPKIQEKKSTGSSEKQKEAPFPKKVKPKW